MVDVTYTYVKPRKSFGRQPMFSEVPAHLLDSIMPDKTEYKNYILRNPVHSFAMVGPSMSAHYINTKTQKIKESGANHAEGGWPKEVNFYDEEATSRYRRRIERDDAYIHGILTTAPKFEHVMMQNNAIALYEMYFKKMPSQAPFEKISVTVKNIFHDFACIGTNGKPTNVAPRPVSSLDFTADSEPKLVVSYCRKLNPIINHNADCFIWDLENPTTPFYTITPPSPCWQIQCSPIDPAIILCGQEDGRVSVFDIRRENSIVGITQIHLAHRDPVTALVFMASRSGTEFFCGSSDGYVFFYDTRNISEPFEKLMMAIDIPPAITPDLSMAHPVTSLDYDKNFPTRFFCGTDTGLILNVNRRGKTNSEKFGNYHRAHYGPVKSVKRNPLMAKALVTCGDYATHIWAEDIYTSPLITGTGQRYAVNDVMWCPQRCSSFMNVSANGCFKIYDLLRSYQDPVITLQCSKRPLLVLNIYNDGTFCCVGDDHGAVYMIQVSEDLVTSGPNDKTLIQQCADREHRREHILDGRMKEIKLKLKQLEDGIAPIVDEAPEENIDVMLNRIETEYKKDVLKEWANIGVPPPKPESKKGKPGKGKK